MSSASGDGRTWCSAVTVGMLDAVPKMLVRAVTLAVLSGGTAEMLLGDQWLTGTPGLGQQVGMMLLFSAFYGSAALLIREVARRTGRGWPTMLLLALAFGLIEEGVLDQTLYNPHYAGLDLLAYGHVGGLGIGVPWTIFVLSLHVIWSIGAPIATAEALFPQPVPGLPASGADLQGPWLTRPGLGVAVGFDLLGAVAISFGTYGSEQFMASPPQLAAALAAAVLVVGAALAIRPTGPVVRRRIEAVRGRWWVAALVGLATTTVYQLAYDQAPGSWPAWSACLVMLAILAVGAAGAARYRLDPAGLAAGAIGTYCWIGWSKVTSLGAGPMVEQTLLALLAIGVVLLAARRRIRHHTPSAAGRRSPTLFEADS